jgi:hypothetical protein
MAKDEESVVATLTSKAEEARGWFNENVMGQNEQVDQVLKQIDGSRVAVMEQAQIASNYAAEQVEEAKVSYDRQALVYELQAASDL